MNHLILFRANNSPGKADATGAFRPEACALHNMLEDTYSRDTVAIQPVNFSKAETFEGLEKHRYKRKLAQRALGDCYSAFPASVRDSVHSISFFCHGWRRGCEFWPRGKSGAMDLAEYCKEHDTTILNLFCCSTAKPHDEGNFARWVAEASKQIQHSMQIMGHETPGHTSWNAHLSFFWVSESMGQWHIDHASANDPTKQQLLIDEAAFQGFRKLMREDQNYRLLLPFMIAD